MFFFIGYYEIWKGPIKGAHIGINTLTFFFIYGSITVLTQMTRGGGVKVDIMPFSYFLKTISR